MRGLLSLPLTVAFACGLGCTHWEPPDEGEPLIGCWESTVSFLTVAGSGNLPLPTEIPTLCLFRSGRFAAHDFRSLHQAGFWRREAAFVVLKTTESDGKRLAEPWIDRLRIEADWLVYKARTEDMLFDRFRGE